MQEIPSVSMNCGLRCLFFISLLNLYLEVLTYLPSYLCLTDMEFGERLASPSSAPSSLHVASSSASSSPAPPQTPSTKCSSPAPSPAGSSPLTTCGTCTHTYSHPTEMCTKSRYKIECDSQLIILIILL